jgi:transposase
LDEYTPDHSTISRTRRLIDLDTHAAVFAWVLDVLARRGLIVGKRVAIDATTLEANAGVPSDRSSSLGWDAEHAVDLDSGAVVAVTLQAADLGDTTTLDATLIEAGMAVAELAVHAIESRPGNTKVSLNGIEELVADKGYLSGAVLKRVKSYGVRSYIPEKRQKGKRHWQGKMEEQQAVYQNRRCVEGDYGKSLLRRHSELVERSFAHCYETGDCGAATCADEKTSSSGN